jgi:hypothetical protein
MRYREAFAEKPNSPEPTFKLAKALDRSGDKDGARCMYQRFLRVGSNTPFTGEARKALERLGSGGEHPCSAQIPNVR